jgi:hypothetical protein
MRNLFTLIGAPCAFANPAFAAVTGKDYHDPKLTRIVVTRPMVSFMVPDDDEAAKKRLDAATAAWRVNAKPPEGCDTLKVGEKYDLDTTSNEEAVALATNCFPGCSPWKSLAPPPRLAGDYLKSVK